MSQRGPRLRKNQYIIEAIESEWSEKDKRRMLNHLRELYGHDPYNDEFNKAWNRLDAMINVKLLVTVRRDGSKFYKVLG